MPTGPRPMRPDEWEAYTLHLQRVPVETIQEQTRLSRPRIAAAVDLGRLHAQATLQTEVAPEAPAAQKHPARIRRAVMPQLPGATVPPPATPSAADPPARRTPAAVEQTAAEPAPAPDLERLARSPEVRAWAAADGWAVPAAGARLPGGIVHAYLRAHGGTQ